MKQFDAARLASVLAAAGAVLAACDGPECDRNAPPQARQDCETHYGGHAYIGGAGGRGATAEAPGVSRGGFGGSVARFFGGFFHGSFGG
jgi:hypothetical protein